jgi:hypothetical protein
MEGKGKGKDIVVQALKDPNLRLPEFLDNRPIKVIRLSA